MQHPLNPQFILEKFPNISDENIVVLQTDLFPLMDELEKLPTIESLKIFLKNIDLPYRDKLFEIANSPEPFKILRVMRYIVENSLNIF